ncbi:MAG: extracellular solute-binding protein [Rubrivivax sp.]|nr:extracellular solute-binding protein [Rubrivivax sp.]
MSNPLRLTALVACLAIAPTAFPQSAPRDVRVHAAGSLRLALNDSAAAFEAAQPGVKVTLTYGPSGLLKDRLAGGESSDVFASANLSHPEALAAAGKAGPVQRFARNAMCALVRPGLDVTSDNLVQRMMDPALKLGVSTPRADPAGDYAVQVFERIEKSGVAGAAATLSAKALQLTGGPNSPPPPADRSVYGALVSQGAADLFLTYCTNAVAAVREHPGQYSVPVPEAINVSASYGVTVLNAAPDDARRFVDFLLSPAGQAVLARHGFAPR